jgi:hypothetical protein
MCLYWDFDNNNIVAMINDFFLMCTFISHETHAMLAFSPQNWLFSFLRSMRKIKWFLVWDKVRTDCNAKSIRMSRKLKQAKAHELKLLLFRGAGGRGIKRDSTKNSKLLTSFSFVYTTSHLFYFFPKLFLTFLAASPDQNCPIQRPVLYHLGASTSPFHVQYFNIQKQYFTIRVQYFT